MPQKETPKKVLVIDDDADVVKLIRACLTMEKFEVITASNGQEGLGKVERERPDLIIADLVMPAMTGWNIGYTLRKNERFKHIPLIILSGMIGSDSETDASEVGDFCMAKPFDPPQLLAKVKELLSKH